MDDHARRSKARSQLLPIVVVFLGCLVAPLQRIQAQTIRTTDYFINHQSIDPFYRQYNLDPTVVIHVREVVLVGNERRAPAQGKVLLLLHGATTPGYIAFDADCDTCSMMRYFALAGWDTFTLDYEGYGLSTRPPVMDLPNLFPESKAPTPSEVAINDVERVVEFITNLRGVEKVHLLGWSLGASRTAPIYTIRHAEKVAKLVLFAAGYRDFGAFEGLRDRADAMEQAKVLLSHPSMEVWYRFGGKQENFIPGAFQAYRAAVLASDPKSGELGGAFRYPAGRIVDLLRARPQFDASRITVPTLVIRGTNDTFGSMEDSRRLTEELGSRIKRFVEIPEGSHYLPFEKANEEFFKAIKEFLEAKAE